MIDYLNSGLDEHNKSIVVLHLAGCKECREELAFLIKVKKLQEENIKEVPQSIKSSAFKLLPQTGYKGLLSVMKPVYDVMEIVNATVRFAFQMI